MNLDGSVLRSISFTDGKIGVISRKDVKRSMPRLRESTVATTLLLGKFNKDPFSYSIRLIGSFRVVKSKFNVNQCSWNGGKGAEDDHGLTLDNK